MNKKLLSAVLLLTLSTSARAAYQIAALPALPSMPLSAPSALPARPVSLPSLPGGASVVLPGVSNLPKISPALPSLPMPVIGRPGVVLPSPANPMPVAPTAVVRAPRANTIARISLAAAPAAQPSAEKDRQRAEKLERLFDGSDDQARHEGRDEVRHTLPETDLLNEIGIQ